MKKEAKLYTGTIVKSISFNTKPYWVIRCDNPNIRGSRNGELPIDPLSHRTPCTFFMGKFYGNIQEYDGRKVNFKVVKIGSDKRIVRYAKII